METKNYITQVSFKNSTIWNILFVVMILGIFILTLFGKVTGEQFVSFCSGLIAGIFSQMNPKTPQSQPENDYPLQEVE